MPCNNCDNCEVRCSVGMHFISCKRCGLRFFETDKIPDHLCINYDQDFWDLE